MSLKNNCKSLIYSLLSSSQRPLSDRAVILMYHSIGNNPKFFTVTEANFIKQMEYLAQNNFQVISLEKLVEYLKNKITLPAKTLVLTLDDGYRNNYTKAWPILQQYNFPATIFLTTDEIGRTEKIPSLNWQEIKEMHDSGLIDFQPHTINHPKLSQLTPAEIEKEILDSKQIIANKLNKQCHFFAYPYGDYNDQVKQIVKKYFLAAVTVKEGVIRGTDELFELKRNAVDSKTTWSQFKGKVLGGAEKLAKIKQIIK